MHRQKAVHSRYRRIGLGTLVLAALLGLSAPVSAAPAVASAAATGESRQLPLHATVNTRDLGGYATADGRRVKWGMLYRSDGLSELDAHDLDYLQQLSLTTITDFRSESERVAAPDKLPEQSPPMLYRTVAVNNPAADVKELGRKVFAGELRNEELEALLDRRAYVSDPALRQAWGDWLRGLAEPGAMPQLFHCTAGKDRTGFAAAIVLLALGVPEETVIEDSMLSNYYLSATIEEGVARFLANAKTPLDEALLQEVVGVSEDSLRQAFAEMEGRYGSVQGYLRDGLGLDAPTQARLQALLLH